MLMTIIATDVILNSIRHIMHLRFHICKVYLPVPFISELTDVIIKETVFLEMSANLEVKFIWGGEAREQILAHWPIYRNLAFN